MGERKHWLVLLFADFFLAFGFVVFVFAAVVIAFFDGKVESVSAGYLLGPPLLFAYLRGEFFHWPKELEDEPTDRRR